MRRQSFLILAVVLAMAATPLLAQTTAPAPTPQATDRQRREADAKRVDAEAEMRKAEQQMREAEGQMREAEHAMREAGRKLADATMSKMKLKRQVVVYGDHARLGVVLRHEKSPSTDAIGAVIEAVTPGSPAEEAGLRTGDIITTYDGKPLTTGEVEADEDESLPTARLIERAASLKDGDTVTLGYRRGDATGTVTVTARRPTGPRVRVFTVPDFEGGNRTVEIPDIPDVDVDMPDLSDVDVDVVMGGRSWSSMELVSLTPELGDYFGTSKGLLVVRTPKDEDFKLKGGDVILKIGDREPATPAQAMRILRSYEPGEAVALQVMRKHEKLTLTAQVPARHGAMPPHAPRRAAPAMPAHPAAPPAPPAPPPPPAPPTGL